jgi:pimeloyl-ACP methyl ester carboxylesterase
VDSLGYFLRSFPMCVILYRKCFGLQVRWSSVVAGSLPDPPTAVFLHGILGCRKNWGRYFVLYISYRLFQFST